MCISIQQDALTAELYVSVRDAVGFYHYDREDARMALDGGCIPWLPTLMVRWPELVVWSAMDVSHSSSKISWYYRNTKGVESVRRCCAHLSHAFENTAATMRTLA